jgi:hypothetical protein
MKDALRSLWRDLCELRTKGEQRHLAALKRLVDEEQWPLAEPHARLHMQHFSDLRPIDRLSDQADFSLSHGAVQLAAEQELADIGTFEAEKSAKR